MENPAYLPIMSPKKLLDDYSLFMKINLQLSKKTIITYRSLLKKFFESIKKHCVSSRDITNFLDSFSSQYPSKFTYANMLKALKVFFREYLRSDIVENFRFPVIPIIPKTIPSIEEMRIFYDAIPTLKEKALFLVYATSGLRRNEILDLLISYIDLEKRMFIPNNSHSGNTKRSWIGFFNDETEELLRQYLEECNNNPKCVNKTKLFNFSFAERSMLWRATREKTGIRITPQILRYWFCCQMGELGVPDRYIDAFCGRVPKSILARHYTDYSPERLKRIYDKANLRVLS